MCKKLIYLIACAVLLSAASGVKAAVLEITPTAPVPGDLDIANFVGAAVDLDNVGTVTDPADFYTNDATTYVAHDRGGQGQTFVTGDKEALLTGIWVQHAGYTEECITWYSMQGGSQLQIRVTDPAASGTDAFVLSSEIYEVTGEEENALPADVVNDPLGTGLWIHVTLDAPVALAANTEYGFDLTSISGLGPVTFFETLGIKDDAEGGNPYLDGSAYVTGSGGAADNVLTPAPGDRIFVVKLVDMEIGFATQPPVIDGEVDGIWADASTQYFVPLDDPANASGSWMVLYDSENLYVIVDVTDDSLQNDSDGSWQDDSVEIYFDGGNTKVNTPLSGDDHQYTFAWTTEEIQGTNIDGATEGIEHAQVDTDTGWRIEIKLPWLSLQGAAPQAGDLIGIDCYYNDDDDGGDSRENKLLSFSAVEGWNDASQWGTAMLTAVTEPEPANPVHQYTFEDGTANDSVGSADGTLVGDATVAGGALVLDGDGDWMSMPGEVIAMNTYSEVTVETWFTSVAGGNTGFHMLAAFGEEGTGANPGFGYKYLFITPARGDDVSRAAIQTSSMDDSPWDEETGVSATVEHDDGIEHHFVATVDATNITFYIDGALIGSESLAAGNEIAGIGQAVAYLGKGVYSVDPLWTGSINEFNIYDRALSLAQVEANYATGPVKPLVHQYTFEDGTANDSVGSAHGTLVGDAAVVDGQLVLDGDGDWMDMPGDVIAMNTFEGLTIEIMFTSIAGGNTGYHMVTAFGEEGTGDNPGYGYKYVCITPARGNDVSRGMIQTVSMDNDPWSEETGVSDVIEHDDGLPHHMVCTVDNTELAFYVDGVLIGTAALDPPGNSIAGIGTDAAHIGKGVYGVDPLWAGSVEELNIYNRALSLAEVQANYAAGPQKVGPAPVDPGTEGLMLHLPLDTASRGVTQDSSDNDLDGTLFGDPTFVEGVVVMAMDFDGDGDYVDCGNDPILDITGPISMSIWIRPDTDGSVETAPLCKADASAGWSWQLRYGWNTDKPTIMGFQFNATGGRVWVYVEQELPIGQWYHIAASHDGATVKCYLDGVETDSAPMTDFAGGPSTLLIGSDGWGSDWIGAIDEVMIYNRALSDLEILYLAGNR